jgi:hypothetical protein
MHDWGTFNNYLGFGFANESIVIHAGLMPPTLQNAINQVLKKDISHIICSLKPIFWEVWDFGLPTRAVQ